MKLGSAVRKRKNPKHGVINPNHACVKDWPEEKADQKLVALKVAAVAKFLEVPTEPESWAATCSESSSGRAGCHAGPEPTPGPFGRKASLRVAAHGIGIGAVD